MLRTHVFCLSLLIALLASIGSSAQSKIDYRGSRTPYAITVESSSYPDTLTPVMINHVGRHGARYATSPKKIRHVADALSKADSAGTITAKGRDMLRLTKLVLTMSEGRWGQLDSIGIAEQEGIAQRMYHSYPKLFNGTEVTALSSYVPR